MDFAQNIKIGSQEALVIVETLLPILEATVPQVGKSAGEINLGVSGAKTLAPVVARLIDNLAAQGVIAADVQSQQLAKLQKVLDFTGPEWTPSGTSPK